MGEYQDQHDALNKLPYDQQPFSYQKANLQSDSPDYTSRVDTLLSRVLDSQTISTLTDDDKASLVDYILTWK